MCTGLLSFMNYACLDARDILSTGSGIHTLLTLKGDLGEG